jgi:hypothetical protein
MTTDDIDFHFANPVMPVKNASESQRFFANMWNFSV